MAKRIFFSVGEPSGDLHASNLMLDLNAHPSGADFDFTGFGGPKMAAAGCTLLEDLTQHAVMFFGGVISKIAKFRRLLKDAEQVFKNERIDLVVLIDYSGFNWLVAKRAKKQGIPVVFYGIPQMWAWAPWRVRKMRKFVDLGICKLPFEKEWLQSRGCQAEYVGHPFFDETERKVLDQEFMATVRQRLGTGSPRAKKLVTILPGSRIQEIKSNLPSFLCTAARIRQEKPETEFCIASLNPEQMQLAKSIARNEGLENIATIEHGRTPELISIAHCCLACSGSVSLELMYYGTPTIIHYRLPRHLYLLQKAFLRIKYITLVNLLWTDSISRQGMQVYDPDARDAEPVPFPEYLTTRDKSESMSSQLRQLLDNPEHRQQKVDMLRELNRSYGHAGASLRASEILVSRFLNNGSSESSKCNQEDRDDDLKPGEKPVRHVA